MKNPLFPFSSYRKAQVTKFQPRVIIWTNYDGLETSMLHTKFHGNKSTGSGGEDYEVEGFLPYMGVAAILVMWPASCNQIFISLHLKSYI